MATGVIIAGGEGRRLGGVAKSELAVGGVRLIERVAARLEGCGRLLVVHGRRPVDALTLPRGAIAVADLDTPYGGPLAGLAAAVDWLARAGLADDILLSVVDAPFLPEDYAVRLLSVLAEAPAAIARHGGQPYPANSAWRFEAVAGLPGGVRAGAAPHSLKRLAAALGAVEVAWPDDGSGDPFANANTPEDLAALEARAARRPAS